MAGLRLIGCLALLGMVLGVACGQGVGFGTGDPGALLHNLSANCSRQLAAGSNNSPNATSVTQMIIASGKLPGDLGNWWDCTHLDGAQYALATVRSKDGGVCKGATNINVCNVGFCVPLECSAADVQQLATKIFFQESEPSEILVNWSADNSLAANPLTWVGIVGVGLPVAFVLLSTAVWMLSSGSLRLLYGRVVPTQLQAARTLHKQQQEEGQEGEAEEEQVLEGPLDRLLRAFASLVPPDSFLGQAARCSALDANVARLVGPIPGDFGALNGLRFLSMLWVIWGHTLFFWGFAGSTDLDYAYNHAMKDYWVQLIVSAVFGVDSFFFLSGFLVTYFVYEMLLEGKPMQWFMYYFHRVWRILPTYCFIMLVYGTLSPVLSNGPLWFAYKHEVAKTLPYWWSNVLFINNFYPEPSLAFMGWGWFLAVDMQFYVVSPFIILLHSKAPKAGWAVLGLLLVIDLTTSTTLATVYGLSPDLMIPNSDFFNHFYQKPYCRASPYLVGMAAAYVYSYIRRKRPSLRISSLLLVPAYVCALAAIYAIIWGTYGDWDWNQFQNTLYLGFSRLGWGLAVGFLMLMSFLGYGGVIHRFVCSRYWQPFAKLTYGAYLSHPVVIQLFYYSQWNYMTFQWYNVMYYFIGHVVCAYSFAVFAYLFVEKPCMNLEPLIIKRIIKLVAKLRGKPEPTLEL